MNKFITDPQEIEALSMKTIGELLDGKTFPPAEESIIKRIIHTTADFDFAEITVISPGALESAREAFTAAETRVFADTMMIAAGVSKKLLQQFGAAIDCFVHREAIIELAQREGITRSMAAVRYAARENPRGIYLIGNAPTALYEVLRLAKEGAIQPALVVGVPVGFVGAAESKEELLQSGLPFICTRGRKGGSPVAVAVFHALLKIFLGES